MAEEISNFSEQDNRTYTVVSGAGEKIKSVWGDQKDRVADGLGKVAQALTATAQKLQEQDQSKVASYFAKAAEKAGEASHYLREKDMHQLFDDTKGFGKRHPAVVWGTAFAIGFLVARFLKPSQKKRQIPQDDFSEEEMLSGEKAI